MDVTFFENQPYYKKNSIQGESSQEECNFWHETSNLSTPKITSTNSPEITSISPPEIASINPLANDNPTNLLEPEILAPTECTQPTHEKELRVYTRRKRPQEKMETQILLEQNHKSNPILESSGNNNSHNDSNDITSYTDLDGPIAIRKGVRKCTKHPIYNFMSYEGLSLEYRTFTTNVSSAEIS